MVMPVRSVVMNVNVEVFSKANIREVTKIWYVNV